MPSKRGNILKSHLSERHNIASYTARKGRLNTGITTPEGERGGFRDEVFLFTCEIWRIGKAEAIFGN